MEITLLIDDCEVQIEGNYFPSEPQTWDDPGTPSEFEITGVHFNEYGYDDEYIYNHHYDELLKQVEDQLLDDHMEAMYEKAESEKYWENWP